MKNKKKIFFAITALILGCFLITACSKKYFGVDEAVWNTLNESERQQVIAGYHKEKEEKEKNALIYQGAETIQEAIFWLSN